MWGRGSKSDESDRLRFAICKLRDRRICQGLQKSARADVENKATAKVVVRQRQVQCKRKFGRTDENIRIATCHMEDRTINSQGASLAVLTWCGNNVSTRWYLASQVLDA